MRFIQSLSLFALMLLLGSCNGKANNHPLNNEERNTQSVLPTPIDTTLLHEWKAGNVVSEEQVAAYGWERCFTIDTISEKIYSRMKGKSYKANCTLPLTELRYLRLLHRNAQGDTQLGEMVCAREIAEDLVEIFRNLYEAHYPIEHMVLIDDYEADDERSMEANNTSCFNFRMIASTGRPSKHGKGMAVDVNTRYNPYVWRKKSGELVVSPKSGKAYTDRKKKFKYKIDENDLCYKEFTKHGFTWGGSWKNRKDYQHFEKK